MKKVDKEPVVEVAPAVAEPAPVVVSGCVVCGGLGGTFTEVAGAARAHAECAASRPDVIRKVKARA